MTKAATKETAKNTWEVSITNPSYKAAGSGWMTAAAHLNRTITYKGIDLNDKDTIKGGVEILKRVGDRKALEEPNRAGQYFSGRPRKLEKVFVEFTDELVAEIEREVNQYQELEATRNDFHNKRLDQFSQPYGGNRIKFTKIG